MSNKKYTNKQLQGLADAELIWPKDSKTYRKPVLDEIEKYRKAKDPKKYLEEIGIDVVHESLWWDCCAVINELAQLLLDEREKTNEIVAELKRDISYALKTLPKTRK